MVVSHPLVLYVVRCEACGAFSRYATTESALDHAIGAHMFDCAGARGAELLRFEALPVSV